MKYLSSFVYLSFSLYLLTSFAWVGAKEDIPHEISAVNLLSSEIDQLKKMEMVVKEEEVKGSDIPRFIFYSLVKASPHEMVAVFLAYEYQKDYVPNVITSEVIKSEAANKTLVRYRMDTSFPLLPDAHYTTSNELMNDDKGNFHVKFQQVEANLAKDAKGEALFLKGTKDLPSDYTLFIYRNHIEPSITLGGLLNGSIKSRMRSDMAKTYKAICEEVTNVQEKKKDLLNDLMGKITRMTAGEDVYGELLQKRHTDQVVSHLTTDRPNPVNEK